MGILKQGEWYMLRLRVQELATAQGYNKNQLQLRSGVTLPLLTRYWNNEVDGAKFDALEKIARALGVRAIDLLEEIPDSELEGAAK
jgi:DNA-binding Xre family transcriptional regulator